MPATNRKAAGTSLVDSLDARIRTRPVDNFASIKTYYRSAILDLRQVGMAPLRHWGPPLAARCGRRRKCRSLASLLACTHPPTPLLPTQADTYRRMHNDDELYIMLSRFARFAAFLCSAQRQTVSRTAGQADLRAGRSAMSIGLPPRCHHRCCLLPAARLLRRYPGTGLL